MKFMNKALLQDLELLREGNPFLDSMPNEYTVLREFQANLGPDVFYRRNRRGWKTRLLKARSKDYS